MLQEPASIAQGSIEIQQHAFGAVIKDLGGKSRAMNHRSLASGKLCTLKTECQDRLLGGSAFCEGHLPSRCRISRSNHVLTFSYSCIVFMLDVCFRILDATRSFGGFLYFEPETFKNSLQTVVCGRRMWKEPHPAHQITCSCIMLGIRLKCSCDWEGCQKHRSLFRMQISQVAEGKSK